MVLNLDKCIGCHTCSIPCKNVWTNRKGAEYMWFNNVNRLSSEMGEPRGSQGRMGIEERSIDAQSRRTRT